jgi:predicted enzyme related to lactoylglutathione lyase
MVADPQGIPFYLMQDQSGQTSRAYVCNGGKPGHCARNELSTTDQAGAMKFYSTLFGWVKDGEMDMGPMGAYEFLRHGELIGAMMTKPDDMPWAGWAHYFYVEDIDAAARTIPLRQGEILFGPSEIPGGDYIITGRDPQGATFSLVGPRKAAV